MPEPVLSTGSSSPFSGLGRRWVWPPATGLGLGGASQASASKAPSGRALGAVGPGCCAPSISVLSMVAGRTQGAFPGAGGWHCGPMFSGHPNDRDRGRPKPEYRGSGGPRRKVGPSGRSRGARAAPRLERGEPGPAACTCCSALSPGPLPGAARGCGLPRRRLNRRRPRRGLVLFTPGRCLGRVGRPQRRGQG